MADSGQATGVWVGRIALGILAAVSLALIGSGGTLYLWIIADWAQNSGGFTGLQMLAWVAGLISAAVMGVGFLLAGLFFRFLRWQHAPLASLVLAVVAVGLIMMTYEVFSDTGHGADSFEIVLLQGSCILALFIVALPPFLHWLMDRRKPVVADIERAS